MLQNNHKIWGLLILLILVGCARRGTITGGEKDTIAPVLKMSTPKIGTTNFKGNEIELTFNEFVKLKDVNKQLIISPPMKKTPDITPSTASKYITIKIKDTLLPNTTYSFNFGQSIQDNNEGNPYRQFKYIFSTGPYLDSLTLKGTIKDAFNLKTDHFVSVMLYEIDTKYSDSIVYKQNPRYITNTLDSAKTFKLENLKAGKYLLVALKDENNNYRFNPKKEKIGFYKKFITLPNDSVFELKMFKEKDAFRVEKPTLGSGNRFIMPYEGDPKNMKITLKNGETVLPTIVTQFPKKDSLQIWFKPQKTDSLAMTVSKGKYLKKYILKLKAAKKDTLSIKAVQTETLHYRQDYTLHSSVPLAKFDQSKMVLLSKDSTSVAFKTEYDEFHQDLKFIFKKEPLEKYKLKLRKGALATYLDKENDSIVYKFSTNSTSDYGNLKINLQQVKRFPILLELTDSKGTVLASAYSEKETTIDFDLLEPAKYTLRIIYDDNHNKEWDPGNFIEKRQSEDVIYFPKPLDVRANWDVEQVFDLSKTP